MKLTKEEFKQYILSEVKKMAQEEGWLSEDSIQSTPVLEKNSIQDIVKEDVDAQIPEEEILNISENTNQSAEKLIKEEFAPVEPMATPSEVKQLSEEFKRWKQLVDFRSPLLIKD